MDINSFVNPYDRKAVNTMTNFINGQKVQRSLREIIETNNENFNREQINEGDILPCFRGYDKNKTGEDVYITAFTAKQQKDSDFLVFMTTDTNESYDENTIHFTDPKNQRYELRVYKYNADTDRITPCSFDENKKFFFSHKSAMPKAFSLINYLFNKDNLQKQIDEYNKEIEM